MRVVFKFDLAVFNKREKSQDTKSILLFPAHFPHRTQPLFPPTQFLGKPQKHVEALPRSHVSAKTAWQAREKASGVNDAESGFVVHRSRRHRADQRDVIDDAGRVRQQFGQLHAALPARMELVGRAEHVAGLFVEVNLQIATGIRLAVPTIQGGFAVEEIHLARPAMLEEADDRLGARRLLGWLGGVRRECSRA